MGPLVSEIHLWDAMATMEDNIALLRNVGVDKKSLVPENRSRALREKWQQFFAYLVRTVRVSPSLEQSYFELKDPGTTHCSPNGAASFKKESLESALTSSCSSFHDETVSSTSAPDCDSSVCSFSGDTVENATLPQTEDQIVFKNCVSEGQNDVCAPAQFEAALNAAAMQTKIWAVLFDEENLEQKDTMDTDSLSPPSAYSRTPSQCSEEISLPGSLQLRELEIERKRLGRCYRSQKRGYSDKDEDNDDDSTLISDISDEPGGVRIFLRTLSQRNKNAKPVEYIEATMGDGDVSVENPLERISI